MRQILSGDQLTQNKVFVEFCFCVWVFVWVIAAVCECIYGFFVSFKLYYFFQQLVILKFSGMFLDQTLQVIFPMHTIRFRMLQSISHVDFKRCFCNRDR